MIFQNSATNPQDHQTLYFWSATSWIILAFLAFSDLTQLTPPTIIKNTSVSGAIFLFTTTHILITCWYINVAYVNTTLNLIRQSQEEKEQYIEESRNKHNFLGTYFFLL